jgi:hypothetical protein
MFGMGLNEFLALVVVIAILSMAGIWPQIIRGLRELRGEHVDESPPHSPSSDTDLAYRMLGVSPSSSWEVVERAYRQKAKLHHPDRGGDEDTMRALNEAYAQIKRDRGVR